MEESANIEARQTIPLRSVPLKNPVSFIKKVVPFAAILLVVSVGIVTGFYLSQIGKPKIAASGVVSDNQNVSTQVKESFAQTFKDQAEGEIQKNDKLEYAQGTHKLIRSGGDSQTAYITSSVLDLDQYVGKKVKVYGETFGSTQVGWLMDVGKVEVK